MSGWDLGHRAVWLLPIVLLAYARGFWRLHHEMPGRYPAWRLASFDAGLLVVFLAIASPLDALGRWLMWLHMTQHMLLLMVAPPLIWLGQPLIALLRSLPPRATKHILGPLLTSGQLRLAGGVLTHPAITWIAFVSVMVGWHLPAPYELGLRSENWHAIQHASFLVASLLFWWPVIGVWPSRQIWDRPMMILYLAGADLINTALSATLTFSTHVLYPSYDRLPRLTGLSALADQGLAGVCMWVPGSVAFLVPAIVLTIQLFERRSPHRERLADPAFESLSGLTIASTRIGAGRTLAAVSGRGAQETGSRSTRTEVTR